MNLLSDILTYIRRIIKSPSNSQITDALLIDYVNRFLLTDVDARIQLFDYKTKYQFETTPGIDQYNMPLYAYQNEPGSQQIASFPLYQGFLPNARVNGINCPLYTQTNLFYELYQNYVQQQFQVATGNGSSGPYTINLPFLSSNHHHNQNNWNNESNGFIIPGHVDLTGIIAAYPISTPIDPILGTTLNLDVPQSSVYGAVYVMATGPNGQNIIVQDSGQFISNNVDGCLYGLMMEPGQSPMGGSALTNGYESSFAITAATQATQAVLTITGNNFGVGQIIQISGVVGMTELNNQSYSVVSVVGSLVTIDVNSTGFTAYISGGTATSFSNVVNYNTGVITNLYFPDSIPAGVPITAQCTYYQSGIPRSILFYNNIITMRPPPNTQYLVELDAYLTPAAFLSTPNAIPFGYMAEYLARGAARKILVDTGDVEQFQFYEPLFKEQETLVWKRSQRIFTSTRTDTIFSNSSNRAGGGYNQSSGGT